MKRGCKLVIKSVSQDGRRFRPSDWIERISTTLATFGPDNRLHYSGAAKPCVVDGEKCLVVDQVLEEENPKAFRYIMTFVEANHLQVMEICETDLPEDKAS